MRPGTTVEDLATLTLMSDGVSVYACTSPDEVVDLLAGGQGVFGIALGRVWHEVDGALAELPVDQAGSSAPGFGAPGVQSGSNELARHRARRLGESAAAL